MLCEQPLNIPFAFWTDRAQQNTWTHKHCDQQVLPVFHGHNRDGRLHSSRLPNILPPSPTSIHETLSPCWPITGWHRQTAAEKQKHKGGCTLLKTSHTWHVLGEHTHSIILSLIFLCCNWAVFLQWGFAWLQWSCFNLNFRLILNTSFLLHVCLAHICQHVPSQSCPAVFFTWWVFWNCWLLSKVDLCNDFRNSLMFMPGV